MPWTASDSGMPAGRSGVTAGPRDRVAVRARGREPEELVDPVGDAVAEGVLEVMGLLIGLRPAEPDDLGEQPLGERVAPERALRGRATRIGQVQVSGLLVDAHEVLADETRDHLAHRGRAVPHPLGEPRRDDRLPLGLHVAHGHQVLGRGFRRLGRVVVGHAYPSAPRRAMSGRAPYFELTRKIPPMTSAVPMSRRASTGSERTTAPRTIPKTGSR